MAQCGSTISYGFTLMLFFVWAQICAYRPNYRTIWVLVNENTAPEDSFQMKENGQKFNIFLLHWVNWRTMTQPRNKGGLGIKPLRGQCFHVRKHIGTCLSEPNKLWVQLVDAKYLHGESILHRHEFPNSSCTWMSLKKFLDFCNMDLYPGWGKVLLSLGMTHGPLREILAS